MRLDSKHPLEVFIFIFNIYVWGSVEFFSLSLLVLSTASSQRVLAYLHVNEATIDLNCVATLMPLICNVWSACAKRWFLGNWRQGNWPGYQTHVNMKPLETIVFSIWLQWELEGYRHKCDESVRNGSPNLGAAHTILFVKCCFLPGYYQTSLRELLFTLPSC